ncbi:MAG TPA: DUF1653 domain-containing protein [Caulobacteraceae bacterium]
MRPTLEAMRGVCGRLGLCGSGASDAEVAAAFDRLVAEQPIYLHKKGGVYRRMHEARSSDDERAVVVYEHLWPHPRGVWVRDAVEFDQPERFARLR